MFYLLDLERTITTGRVFYWKANKHGYTDDITEAGLFTAEAAAEIVYNDFDKRTVTIHKNVVDKLLKEYF
jgi:hypothetical protein